VRTKPERDARRDELTKVYGESALPGHHRPEWELLDLLDEKDALYQRLSAEFDIQVTQLQAMREALEAHREVVKGYAAVAEYGEPWQWSDNRSRFECAACGARSPDPSLDDHKENCSYRLDVTKLRAALDLARRDQEKAK
jgi:hypothetical protein